MMYHTSIGDRQLSMSTSDKCLSLIDTKRYAKEEVFFKFEKKDSYEKRETTAKRRSGDCSIFVIDFTSHKTLFFCLDHYPTYAEVPNTENKE